MTLSAIALTTVERAKAHLGLSDASASYRTDALDIYYATDQGAATSATIEVRENTIVGSAPGGTGFSFDMSLVGLTISSLATLINATAGWVATALTYGDAVSASLVEAVATSCFGVANRKKLLIPNDRKMEFIIERVTGEIEKWLDRGILSRNYDELYDGEAGVDINGITLRQPDVTGVTSLFAVASHVLTVRYGGTNPRATIEVTDTGVVLRSRSGSTVLVTTATTTFVISPTISSMASAIGAVTGWTASVPLGIDGNDPSAFLLREGVRNTKSVDVALNGWEDYNSDYTVDYTAGLITFGPDRWPLRANEWDDWTGKRRLRLIYTAGLATVPADVDGVALEMISAEWNAAISDPLLQSESIGSYSYTLTAARLDSGTTAAKNWQKRLAGYRRWLP